MKKQSDRHYLITFIVEISILSSLGLVLDFTCGIASGWLWPEGGSVSFAMLCIFIASYRHGIKGGLLTGLLVGSIQMLWAGSGYLIHPVQIILDYPLAYVLLGFSGLFASKIVNNDSKSKYFWIIISIIIPCFLRLTCHMISGIYYWYVPFWPSLIYNGSFMGISALLSCIVVICLANNKFIMNSSK